MDKLSLKTVIIPPSALQEIVDAIPDTWIDPLLSGPSKAIKDPPYNGHDIEYLLTEIKARVRAIARKYTPIN